MPAPPVLDSLDGTRGGSHYRHFVSRTRGNQLAEPLSGVDGQLGDRILDEPAEDDVRDPHIWRIRRSDTPLHLFTHERDVIVGNGVPHGMMRRQSRLDQHTTALRATSRSSRNLAQKLKAAFRCAEIREIDPDIRVYDSDESDIREVESLGDHLCP